MGSTFSNTAAPRAETHVLAVILARAGSKGLPSKNILPIAGRPMIAHTIAEAKAAERVDAVCVTTDLSKAADVARELGVFIVERPPELASDTATVDSAVRHAVETYERLRKPVSHVVILYGNVPIRAPGIIDKAIDHLIATGCDSVRSVTPVDKQHPDWLHRLEGDKLVQFRKNSIYRRQDLEPLFYHDGAVLAVTRASMFVTSRDDNHAFLGKDRRAVVSEGGPTVDVDSPADLRLAEGLLTTARRADSIASEPEVRIADRTIGAAYGVFIIAEAGVNHDGSIEKATRLIDAAREAGADAVKFQYFAADRLVAAGTPTCQYQKEHDVTATGQREMLRRLELKPDEFRALADHARRVRIHFLATPFGLDELRFLATEIRTPAIKIASPDIINVPLLNAACGAGLPIILSTGASSEHEIECAVELISAREARSRLILLHCVSSYPTPANATRLRSIATLQRRFGCPVGFSDHTAEIETGAAAVLAGACVLEKHLTLDRRATGPDHFFSLEPCAFRDYVQQARAAHQNLGDGRLRPSASELEVRELARGRIVARRAILAGETLQPDMLAVRRAASGLSAADWFAVIGTRARSPIAAESPVTMSQIEPLAAQPSAVS